MTERLESKATWTAVELKRLLSHAFAEGKGEDTQLHQSLMRRGIVSQDEGKELIAALEAVDEIWKPLHRAFDSARVTSTRRLFRLFPWLSKQSHHKRARALTVDEFRARVLEIIASCYGLPGRGINPTDDFDEDSPA